MEELSLEELKVIELDILKMFDQFCKKHNIRYFLGFGTLLGAIRYKKFIPWDDDIDVLVPREDYDRLMTLFEDTQRYRLYAYERNRKYRYPFAKLCDMDTSLIEIYYPHNGVELGVNIDIFPLDNWDDDLEKIKRTTQHIRKNMDHLSFSKMGKSRSPYFLKAIIWNIVISYCRVRGSSHYIKKIFKESHRSEQRGSRYMGVIVWPIWGERGIIPVEAFADAIDVEFEGELFPAPIGYDTYLRSLYGDYMPEPPMEKRKTHHYFKAYRPRCTDN